MKVFLLIFVVLAALSVVAGGVWVAIALIGALSRPRVSDTYPVRKTTSLSNGVNTTATKP